MDYCGFEARLKDLRVAEMASLCWGDMGESGVHIINFYSTQ